jgi:hypothetical protein
VIKSNLRRQGEGLATSHALSGREQDLFLHTDVFEKPGAELGIGSAIDRAGLRHRTLEKPVETGMITSQEAVDSSSHERFLLPDNRGRDAVMSHALRPRRQPIWIRLCVQQMGVISHSTPLGTEWVYFPSKSFRPLRYTYSALRPAQGERE